ncbi:MAG TPA: hypothetical protein VM735_06605 [Candidatus Kapabacteria bacterium]|nr:hypothetical protein [Candidatus Kapabacteria bacterium]
MINNVQGALSESTHCRGVVALKQNGHLAKRCTWIGNSGNANSILYDLYLSFDQHAETIGAGALLHYNVAGLELVNVMILDELKYLRHQEGHSRNAWTEVKAKVLVIARVPFLGAIEGQPSQTKRCRSKPILQLCAVV